MEARPVVGLMATPKSSRRPRLPGIVQALPLGHPMPVCKTGDAVVCSHVAPASVERVQNTCHCAPLAVCGAPMTVSSSGSPAVEVPYHASSTTPAALVAIAGNSDVADGAASTCTGALQVSPPSTDTSRYTWRSSDHAT